MLHLRKRTDYFTPVLQNHKKNNVKKLRYYEQLQEATKTTVQREIMT